MLDEKLRQAAARLKIALEREDWQGMIEAWSTFIATDPTLTEAYVNRGNAYKMVANHAKAIEDYSKALELRPDDQFLYKSRGSCYHSLGMLKAAIDDFSRAIELDAKDPDVYYKRGCAFSEENEWSAAIEDFSSTVTHNPAYAAAYNNRGKAFAEIGQSRMAIHDFNSAISIDSQQSSFFLNRGQEYAKLGNHELAIRDFSMALTLNPNDEMTLYNRALSYKHVGLLDEALADLSQLIQLESILSYRAFQERAQLYTSLGQDVLAQDDLLNASAAIQFAEELCQQRVMNDQLLKELSNQRISLDVVRMIDHSFECPASASDRLVAALQEMGFTVDPLDLELKKYCSSKNNATSSTWVRCHEQATPNEMRQRTFELARLAFKLGASYDGWGTPLGQNEI